MPTISLTQFVDFVVATGTPKLTRLKQIKRENAEKYEIWKDHWKILRDGIVDFHAKADGDRKFFDRLLAGVTKEEKRRTYEPLVTNYKRFLGRKTIDNLRPDHHITWKHKTLEVRVNPELRFMLNEREQVIKLYFKKAPLAKSRIDVILLLMKHALPASPGQVTYCLLDVNHNKTYMNENPNDEILPLLIGEAESFLSMWANVR